MNATLAQFRGSVKRAVFAEDRRAVSVIHRSGQSLQHLFIRLLTTGLARDYIIRRFLKSNEAIVLGATSYQEQSGCAALKHRAAGRRRSE